MRGFYLARAARLLPPPPGRVPRTQIQIQLLHPLRTHTLQFCQGDTMILSNAKCLSGLRKPENSATLTGSSAESPLLTRYRSLLLQGKF